MWRAQNQAVLLEYASHLRTSYKQSPVGGNPTATWSKSIRFLEKKNTSTWIKMETEERPSKIRKIQQDKTSATAFQSQDKSSEVTHGNVEEGRAGNISAHEQVSNQEFSIGERKLHPELNMSKSAMKRERRQQAWEDGREARKQWKKEKRTATKERRKIQRAAAVEAGALNETEANSIRPRPTAPKEVPLTFIVDCEFDDLMTEKEMISLSSQVTRCYSENRKALFRPYMVISSFDGRMKTRFETVLQNPHARWANVRLEAGDFVEVAEKAKAWMIDGPKRGLDDCLALQPSKTISPTDGEIVYLTADSDETLEELRPYSTYVIGGIVDRNRHKGICYKRAMDRKIKTAKLPIGEFMQMSSRAVLTTNHVYEIMLRWLELKNWGQAFMKVIPKRKGGVLRQGEVDSTIAEDTEDAELFAEELNVLHTSEDTHGQDVDSL